jgi:hypothetical protein
MKHVWIMRIIGIILICLGLLIRYVIARRKFNRRAMTGAQGFSSFEKAWITALVEKNIGWLSTVMIIIGFLALAASVFSNW